MARTIKPVRRNNGNCICRIRVEWTEERATYCRYGWCVEYRCPACRGKLGGWGPVGCKCDGGPRWARHPGMRTLGHWDYRLNGYIPYRSLVKPSLRRRSYRRNR